MQNNHIAEVELVILGAKVVASDTGSISLHELGKWIKAQTGNEYIVINRMFVKNLMDGVAATRDKNLNKAIASKWNFEAMSIWL